MEALWFILGGAALAAGITIAVVRRERGRRDDLRRVARRLGLEYLEKPDLSGRFDGSGFALFERGRARRIESALVPRGDEDVPMILEYAYTTGGGQSSSRRRTTVFVFRVAADLPRFRLHPEHVGHKILAALGGQDIDFEGNPEFSSAYVLKGDDEAAVRRLFTRPVMAHLLRHRGVTVEGAGNRVLVYRNEKRQKPEELRTALDRHRQLAELLSA